MQYVASITSVLSGHLGWHRARLTFIARFTAVLLTQTTTNLKRLALTLKAGVKPASNYRRIQRFLKAYDLDQAALGRLLLHLAPTEAPYVLTVDRTEWHFGRAPVNVLVAGVACGDVAVPIAWTALPTAGGSGSEDQIQMLEAMLDVVDPASVEALVADREFISARWLRRLQAEGVQAEGVQAEGVPFAIRLRSDRRVALPEDTSASDAPASDASALPARMFARSIPTGEEHVLRRVHLNTDSSEDAPSERLQPVDVVMKRTGPPGTSDPFVILAVWKAEPSRAMDLYRQRWSIETLFAALKSRGFDLEQTHLTTPGRIERLIGLLALALV